MSIIRFLHISDLHLNKIGFETETMREKLPNYIQSLQQDNIPFKYIFFTGDLRYAPAKDYPLNAIDYFHTLCNVANIEKDNLFVALGNHDIIREEDKRLLAIKELETKYFDSDRIIDSRIIVSLKSGRNEYYDILNKIISPSQYEFQSDDNTLHFVIKKEDINVVIVDSTISYTEKRQSDLIIGAYDFKKVLEKCDTSKPTIVLSHYALDSMETTEQKAILRTLKDNHVQLWLAGHKHNEIIRKELDYVYTAQSGNQTFERGTSPGFVEGILDTKQGVGCFYVHKWNMSAGWGVYQTLVDYTDQKGIVSLPDRTKYEFVLDDWRIFNEISGMCESKTYFAVIAYLMNYSGNSFFADILAVKLNIELEKILSILNELKRNGFIRPLNSRRNHWEIIKKPTSI